jgi:cyclohexa-1,5-dienecarbonyl-CoA hydratase
VVASEAVAGVALERRGHVAVVTLRRPQALNAITAAMADATHELLTGLAADRDVWVVVLAAEGERAFCVGADLAEREGMSPEQLVARRASLRRLFATVRETPQPTIASVFGYVLGGGFELALGCDLIVAADDATFGLPEARVGLVPAGGGTYLLPRAIGPARARELIFTGRRLDAAEAHALGLVAEVVPRTGLDEAVAALADRIAKSSPVSTRLAKAALRRAQLGAERAAIDAEEEALAEAAQSRDAEEGVRAFGEKRPPEWENR